MAWICDKNGNHRCEIKQLSYNGTFMEVSSITVTVESPAPVSFAIGDYIDWDYDGLRYTLDIAAGVEKQARRNSVGNAFVYENLVFLSPLKAADNADFLDVILGNTNDFLTNTEFSFYGTAWDYAKRLEANLCRLYGSGTWKVRIWTGGICYDDSPATGIDTGAWENKLVDVSGIKCLGGFQQIYDLWGCAYVFSVVNGVNYVDFYDDFEQYAKAWAVGGVDKVFAYGKGNGLYKIRHTPDADHVLVTRLRPYGSGENIPANYYLNSPDYHVDGNESSELAISHLMLPASQWTKGNVKHPSNAYLEQNTDLYGVREGVVLWDGSDEELGEIKPSIYGLTIQDLLSLMSAGDSYRPVEAKWPDTSQRIDKIITGASPTDNGAVAEAGYDFTEVEASGSLEDHSFGTGGSYSRADIVFDDLVMGTTPSVSHPAEYRIVPTSQNKIAVSFEVQESIASTINVVKAYLTPYVGDVKVEDATFPCFVSEETISHTVDGITYKKRYNISLLDSTGNPIVFSTMRTGAVTFHFRAHIDFSVENSGFPFVRNEYAVNFDLIRGSKAIDGFFAVTIPQIGFDLSAAVSSGAKLCMRSGANQPREFAIVPSSVRYLADSDTWYIRCKRSVDQSIKTYFPNSDAAIAPGDEYYLSGIVMPSLYVEIAANKLLAAATAWLNRHSKPRMLSSVDVDNKIMVEESIVLKEGMALPISDTDLGITTENQESRVIDNIRIEEGTDSIRTFSITLRDKKEKSSLDAAIRGATSNFATNDSVSEAISAATGSGHESLTGRDKPNQHPISSITGLEEALLSSEYFQLGSLNGLVELKPNYAYLSPNKGLIFNEGNANDAYADIYLRTVSNVKTLYTPRALNVGGATTINDALSVVGATTFQSTLGVTGKATLSGGAEIPTNKTLKIGEATIQWVPGENGDPGYLQIDKALLTLGDQIVQSGTPGGGGGGAGFLYELGDTLHYDSGHIGRYDGDATVPDYARAGDLLAYNGADWYAVKLGSGLSIAAGTNNIYTLSALGSVTSVAGVSPTNGDVPAADLKTALGISALSGYVVATSVLQTDTDKLVTGAAVYSAIASAVSSVLKFVGTTTSDISDGSTTNPIIINGSSYTAVTGNVVLKGNKEFLWNSSSWEEMGDEASWALKTVTITGTGYLTGGGTLEQNRTIDIASTYKGYIDEGHSAYGWGNHANAGYLLASVAATTYHPKGGDTQSNTFKIGGATFTFTPAVPGGAPASLTLDCALITQGDQIVVSGTPGGGDTPVHYLRELTDVVITDIANTQMLAWDSSARRGLGAWVNIAAPNGSVQGVRRTSDQSAFIPDANGIVTIPDYPTIPSSYAWSAITGTPSTLYGYGITDAKIDNGQITLGSNTITPLTSHQTIYGLTLKVGTAQVGTYTPNSAAQTLTITQANLTSVLNSTYHPYGGDTQSNTFKIGGATFTFHPAVQGTSAAYMELDCAILTHGDQIVDSGTPGGGGSGGAGYLYELGDVYSTASYVKRADGSQAQPGDILTYYDNDKKWVAGNTIKLSTDTSWTSSDRSIPFGNNSDASIIQWYYTDSSKGLTYNPNTGALKAGSFVKRGGTASQFLKADGTVDATDYLPLTAGSTKALTGTLYVTMNTSSSLLELTNNYDARWVPGWEFSAPNLSAGHSATLGFGKTNATNNLGVLEFYYDSSGSNDNYVGLGFYGNNARFRVYASGNTSVSGSMTASSFVKANGTSAQFLKADGSVDSNTYLTTSTAESTYVAKAGDSMTGVLTITKSSTDAILTVNNTRTPTWNGIQTFAVLNPNQNTTYYVSPIIFGKEKSEYNCGSITYGYAGSGSTSNYIGIGLYSHDNLFKVYGSGKVNFGAAYSGLYFSIDPGTDGTNFDIGWNYSSGDGAGIGLRSKQSSLAGQFNIYAKRGSTCYALTGKPDGTLTWGEYPLLHTGNLSTYSNNIQSAIGLGNYVPKGTAVEITAKHTFSNGFILNTDTSWSNSDRSIPFGAHNVDDTIAWYYTDSTNGLTFNPRTGTLKAGSFVKRGNSGGFLKADGTEDTSTYLTTSSAESTYVKLTAASVQTIRVTGNTDTSFTLKSGNASASYLGLNTSDESLVAYIGITTTNGLTFYDTARRTVYHSGNSNMSTVPWTCSYLTVNANAQTTHTLYINGDAYLTSNTYENQLTINRAGSDNDAVIVFSNGVTGYLGAIGLGKTRSPFYTPNHGTTVNYLYHSGNSNSTSVDWAAASLTLNGSISGATTISCSGNMGVGGNMSVSGTTTLINAAHGDVVLYFQRGTTSDGYTDWSLTDSAGNLIFKKHYSGSTTTMVTFNESGFVSFNGDITSTGDQVISSDATKKRNWQPLSYGVEDIAKCTAGTFEWIADGRKSAGSKAQDWKPLVPELVHGEAGNMTLAYGQIALLNTVLLARHETEQDKEIRELRVALGKANKKIEGLEKEVKRLRS